MLQEAERFFLSTKRLSLSACARGGKMALPCPGGQGALRVCAFDAVCPAGKGAAERRAGYGCITEKAVPQALCASGGCRRAGEREALPPSLPRQRFPPAVPRGDRRALPAPAQGTSPLGIPFWGTGLTFPPSPRPPKRRRRQAPARGLAAVCALSRPARNVKKRPCPLLVGHGRVDLEPKALADRTAVIRGSSLRRRNQPCGRLREWRNADLLRTRWA